MNKKQSIIITIQEDIYLVPTSVGMTPHDINLLASIQTMEFTYNVNYKKVKQTKSKTKT